MVRVRALGLQSRPCSLPDPSITDWNAVLWENGSVVDLTQPIELVELPEP